MLATEQATWTDDLAADVMSELPFLDALDLVQRDDAVLDRWIGSLTPDQFERILHSLALVL